MSFLWTRNKQKSPQELIRQLVDLFNKVDVSDKRKTFTDISRTLDQIKLILDGGQESDPSPDMIGAIAQEVYTSNILILLVAYLHVLDFDGRKGVLTMFTTLLRRRIGNRNPTVDYLASKPDILYRLIAQNANIDIALDVGTIMRDCIKHESLAAIVIQSTDVWKYFDYINSSTFEVATDAMSTLHDLLTLHPQLCSSFLASNSEAFTEKMNSLMKSSSYVTQRQSLKLMAILMRQRANYNYMTEYIDSGENLKLNMTLLKNKSKNIQYEAFHIFKIFVANPRKSKPIIELLGKNKVKLLNFLPSFQDDRKNEDNFNEEKLFIIKHIRSLPNYVPSASASSTSLNSMTARQGQTQLSPMTASFSSTCLSATTATTSTDTTPASDNHIYKKPNPATSNASAVTPPLNSRDLSS